MKALKVLLFSVSLLGVSSVAYAEMVGSCLIKDRDDSQTVALCETLFTDESYRILFDEDPLSQRTEDEWGRSCGGFLNQVGKEWSANKKCPTESLVGICHDESGTSVIGRGSLHYYDRYVNSDQGKLDDLEDACKSRGKIFTRTNSSAEYEEAVDKIPLDLESHQVLASCIMPSRSNPEGPGKCSQYHQFTKNGSLEKRKTDCIGEAGQNQSKYEKANTWSETDATCPSKYNYAVCKSAVVSEYYYEDEVSLGKKMMDELRQADRVACESSGRRYFPID